MRYRIKIKLYLSVKYKKYKLKYLVECQGKIRESGELQEYFDKMSVPFSNSGTEQTRYEVSLSHSGTEQTRHEMVYLTR